MKLTAEDLKQLSEYAITAATRAGELIADFLKKEVEVKRKTAGENLASQVVTEVDFLSQNIILKTLASTFKKYDLALLTEENPDDGSRLQKDYFWCIDPLDGTLPFIEKRPGFSVSIALVDKSGKAVIGVIYDPIHQKIYHAVDRNGAFKNGKNWTLITPSNKNNCLTFITDRSFEQHIHYNTVLQKLKERGAELGLTDFKIIQHGGAAMNAIWVLENQPACYFKFPKTKLGGGSIWDFAASACLFNEIGENASNIHGNALHLNAPNSTFMNEQGLVFASNLSLYQFVIDLYKSLQ